MGKRPIVTVKKELYKKHAKPGDAAVVRVQYVGPELQRRELHSIEATDDVLDVLQARWSTDNGRTWSEFVPVQPSTRVDYNGVKVGEGEGINLVFDPQAGVLVQMWGRQIVIHHHGVYPGEDVRQKNWYAHGQACWHNFAYSRYSRDFGRTWSEPQKLIYEDGDQFDPEEPRKPTFINHNEGGCGNNILLRSDGTLVTCLSVANAPGDPKNNDRAWKMGSILFTGKWNVTRQDYDWTPGARVEISPEHSARGLLEPEVAEFNDGRLLVVWRGSTHGWDGTVAKLPGRKFFSVSTDGGKTLDPPKVWTYADGTDFYSPSSYHRMIRHSLTGKLYWLGNIVATPPHGNDPRYPLVIAEVDEAQAAIKKSTVTAIDDRLPTQGQGIQFSNFSLLEDHQTHAVELYLTTYGQEQDPKDEYTADNYKYTLQLE